MSKAKGNFDSNQTAKSGKWTKRSGKTATIMSEGRKGRVVTVAGIKALVGRRVLVQSETHAEPTVIKPTKPFTKITSSDYVFKATGPVKMGTMSHLGLKLKD